MKFDSWLCWPLLCTWILQTFKHCLQFNLTSTFLQLLFVLSPRYHEQHREQAATTTVWQWFSWRWDTLSSLSFTPAQPGLHLHKLLSSFYIERVHSITILTCLNNGDYSFREQRWAGVFNIKGAARHQPSPPAICSLSHYKMFPMTFLWTCQQWYQTRGVMMRISKLSQRDLRSEQCPLRMMGWWLVTKT